MAVNRAGIFLEVSNTKHRSGISQFLNLNFCRLRTSFAPGKCQDSFDLRFFRQELSRILPTCLPAACASAILRIIWNHADSWGAADDSTWLNLHISTLATSCLMSNLFDLSVLVSRSTQGVPDSHFFFTRKKKWVVTPCKKIWSQVVMVSYDFGFPLPKRETSHGHHSLLWLLWATAVVPSAGPKCRLKWASGVHPQ